MRKYFGMNFELTDKQTVGNYEQYKTEQPIAFMLFADAPRNIGSSTNTS